MKLKFKVEVHVCRYVFQRVSREVLPQELEAAGGEELLQDQEVKRGMCIYP
jgi:hypothetical protein